MHNISTAIRMHGVISFMELCTATGQLYSVYNALEQAYEERMQFQPGQEPVKGEEPHQLNVQNLKSHVRGRMLTSNFAFATHLPSCCKLCNVTVRLIRCSLERDNRQTTVLEVNWLLLKTRPRRMRNIINRCGTTSGETKHTITNCRCFVGGIKSKRSWRHMGRRTRRRGRVERFISQLPSRSGGRRRLPLRTRRKKTLMRIAEHLSIKTQCSGRYGGGKR